MNRGRNVKSVKAVILLGPADSYGYTTKSCLNKDELNKLIEEAKGLVKVGDKEIFLKKKWLCHGNVLPKGADSFLNFFAPKSELSIALPLRQGKNLKLYQNIKVPILVVIGDEEEYTVIPITKALEVLKKENSLAECVQLKNCNHDFEKKEEELSEVIIKFLKNKVKK